MDLFMAIRSSPPERWYRERNSLASQISKASLCFDADQLIGLELG